jgi:hypothetical protein
MHKNQTKKNNFNFSLFVGIDRENLEKEKKGVIHNSLTAQVLPVVLGPEITCYSLSKNKFFLLLLLLNE